MRPLTNTRATNYPEETKNKPYRRCWWLTTLPSLAGLGSDADSSDCAQWPKCDCPPSSLSIYVRALRIVWEVRTPPLCPSSTLLNCQYSCQGKELKQSVNESPKITYKLSLHYRLSPRSHLSRRVLTEKPLLRAASRASPCGPARRRTRANER